MLHPLTRKDLSSKMSLRFDEVEKQGWYNGIANPRGLGPSRVKAATPTCEDRALQPIEYIVASNFPQQFNVRVASMEANNG